MKGVWAIVSAATLSLVAWAAWPRNESRSAPETATACAARLRSVFGAVSIYASDHDGRLPRAPDWCDSISSYLTKVDDLRCPVTKAFGYAFYLDLQGSPLSENPAGSVLLFDSADLRKNAADNLRSLPSPPRHTRSGSPEPMNNALYADGHVAAVPR